MRLLSKLQKKIEKVNEEVWGDPYTSWVKYSEVSRCIQLEFYGEGYDDDPSQKLEDLDIEDNYPYIALLDTLVSISEKVSHLSFSGPDEGANGFRNWDFTRLIKSKSAFGNLKSLKIALTDPADHNMSCITDILNDYEENGMISNLVDSMPNLETLVLPSAPNKEFFNLTLDKLCHLRVESGYSSQEFISNYAESEGFKNLTALDFSDVSFVVDPEERDEMGTSFESFEKLFRSKAFDSVAHFKLRNSKLNLEQLTKLQSLRPDLQFFVISAFSGSYVDYMKIR